MTGVLLPSSADRSTPTCFHHPIDTTVPNKRKATLLGMVGSAMQKYPSASKGDLKDVWNAAVDECYAARKAQEAEEAKKRAAKRRVAAARKR